MTPAMCLRLLVRCIRNARQFPGMADVYYGAAFRYLEHRLWLEKMAAKTLSF